MKIFIKGFVAILAGIFLLQFSYFQLAKNYDERTLQFERIKKKINIENPKVLLFGDSRILYGVDHTLMGNEFLNVGFWSERLNFSLLKYSKILENSNGIKMVIFQIDYNTFSKTNNNFYEAMTYVNKFEDYQIIDNDYKSFLFNKFLYNISMLFDSGSRLVFSYGITKTLAKLLNINDPNLTDTKINTKCLNVDYANFGFRKVDGLLEKKEDLRNKIMNKVEKDYYNTGDLNQKSVENFSEIINLSKKNNIMLVGLRMPSILGGVDMTTNLKNIENYIGKLNFDYFLDYRDVLNDPAYFNDQLHLNVKGSEIFSEILRDDLVKIMSLKTSKYKCVN